MEYKIDLEKTIGIWKTTTRGETTSFEIAYAQLMATLALAERLGALVEAQAQNHEDSQRAIALLEKSLIITQGQYDAGLQSLAALIEVEKIRIDNHNASLIGLDDRIRELEREFECFSN